MSIDTWAIVAATGLGPIAAVWITFLRDDRKSRRDRRLHVFRTLMATRRTAISPEHVGALNLVEVEFYRCVPVEKAWSAYRAHLNNKTDSLTPEWNQARDRLLAKLLSEMGKVLGFEYDTLDIYQGGYAPEGWQYRDDRLSGLVDYVHALAVGQKVVPIWLVGSSLGGEAQPDAGPPSDDGVGRVP